MNVMSESHLNNVSLPRLGNPRTCYDDRGVVLLNCAGAMNRKGLTQDGLVLRLITPIFIAVEYLLQQPKVANFLFNK